MRTADAFDQISVIRQQMSRAHAFLGYSAATTAFSGLVAIVTSHIAANMIRQGALREGDYLTLWCVAAFICLAVVGIDVIWRVRRSQSALQRDLTSSAIEHFMPSLTAGGLLTVVLFRFAHETVWMLPGLWMILFGLGIHASRRLLPRFSGLIAGYYLFCGLFVISLREWAAFNPWTMGAVFGLGQFMAAGLLRFSGPMTRQANVE